MVSNLWAMNSDLKAILQGSPKTTEKSQIFILRFITKAKIQLEISIKNNFMVEEHHTMTKCVERMLKRNPTLALN